MQRCHVFNIIICTCCAQFFVAAEAEAYADAGNTVFVRCHNILAAVTDEDYSFFLLRCGELPFFQGSGNDESFFVCFAVEACACDIL